MHSILNTFACMISLATYSDYLAIVELWEQSVRVTHPFPPEAYLQEIKALLPSILPQVKIFVWREKDGVVRGFAGVAGSKIEMLFVRPDSFGLGLGKQLVQFCIYSLGVSEVDVNEQNETAVRFYQKMDYQLVGRDELDSLGKPYPILHLRHS